jgi:thiamine-phosphate pyrophosphorylase
MKPLNECHLYCFVDTAYLRGRAPMDIARQLCDGGADLIQLRAKQSSPEEVRRIAESIIVITRKTNVGLVINDYPDIAREIGAEFCHLGQEDFVASGFAHVRQFSTPGHQLRIGLSSHAPEQARLAAAAGADYVAVGPVYATGTKPQAKPVTLEYVRWAAANLTLPWFAIGGINLDTLDDVLAAGARRICVVSAILNPDDVRGACRKFRERCHGYVTSDT